MPTLCLPRRGLEDDVKLDVLYRGSIAEVVELKVETQVVVDSDSLGQNGLFGDERHH